MLKRWPKKAKRHPPRFRVVFARFFCNSVFPMSATLSSSTGAPKGASNSARAVHRALVVEQREVAPRHFTLRLAAPQLASNALPGQFVHVLTRPQATADAPTFGSFDPLLRRAFSIMDVDAEQGTVELLFRVEGRGTALLSSARVGDTIDLIGPLGQPFDLSPFGIGASSGGMFHVKQREFAHARALVVGGGVGVPPLVFLGVILSDNHVLVEALIGARGCDEVIGKAAFEQMGIAVQVATDDGSVGHRGRVTELLQRELARDDRAVVYACGPWPMLRAVAAICEQAEVPCQVSLEEAMPCGIGVCNGCVVRAKTPFAAPEQPDQEERVGDEWSPYHQYRRICVEGPACWAHEIDWSRP